MPDSTCEPMSYILKKGEDNCRKKMLYTTIIETNAICHFQFWAIPMIAVHIAPWQTYVLEPQLSDPPLPQDCWAKNYHSIPTEMLYFQIVSKFRHSNSIFLKNPQNHGNPIAFTNSHEQNHRFSIQNRQLFV